MTMHKPSFVSAAGGLRPSLLSLFGLRRRFSLAERLALRLALRLCLARRLASLRLPRLPSAPSCHPLTSFASTAPLPASPPGPLLLPTSPKLPLPSALFAANSGTRPVICTGMMRRSSRRTVASRAARRALVSPAPLRTGRSCASSCAAASQTSERRYSPAARSWGQRALWGDARGRRSRPRRRARSGG